MKLSPSVVPKGFMKQANGARKRVSWNLDRFILHGGSPGNIGTLGGLGKQGTQGITQEKEEAGITHPWKYLNTNVKNCLKVLIRKNQEHI